jgi:hypothetical protein
MKPTLKRIIIIVISVCVAIVNIRLKIHNMAEYKHHISSPSYLRHLYHKYYITYNNDNKRCFPTTSCYEFVTNTITGQRIKQWYARFEPNNECTLTDWKTADSNVCHSISMDMFDNAYDWFMASIIIDVAGILIILINVCSKERILIWVICSQSINNIFGLITNITVFATSVIDGETIIVMFLCNIVAWIIGFILLILYECSGIHNEIMDLPLRQPHTQTQSQSQSQSRSQSQSKPQTVQPTKSYPKLQLQPYISPYATHTQPTQPIKPIKPTEPIRFTRPTYAVYATQSTQPTQSIQPQDIQFYMTETQDIQNQTKLPQNIELHITELPDTQPVSMSKTSIENMPPPPPSPHPDSMPKSNIETQTEPIQTQTDSMFKSNIETQTEPIQQSHTQTQTVSMSKSNIETQTDSVNQSVETNPHRMKMVVTITTTNMDTTISMKIV